MPEQTIQQLSDLAFQHYHAGRLDQARDIFERILAAEPNNSFVLNMLGVIASLCGNNPLAVELINRAITINPLTATFCSNLSVALNNLGQHDAAIHACQQAIRLEPYYADAYFNLGNACMGKGDIAAAIAALQTAIKIKPDYVQAHYNLGNALLAYGQMDAAIASFHKTLAIRPDLVEARINLGNALGYLGNFDAAIGAYQTVLRQKPDYYEVYNNLGNALKDQGRIEEALDAYRTCFEKKPDMVQFHSSFLYTLHFHPAYSAKTIYHELVNWRQRHALPLKKFIRPHINDRDPERRLKIGYVSPDFYAHVVGWNLLPLLQQHNHEQWEIFAYSAVVRPDEWTRKIRSCCDVWRDITGIDDQQVARMIRDDKIDILIDLALHTAGNRLLIFAPKPAPVQVTWLGYPGSTGLETIDYRLSDPYLDPPQTDLSVYSEQTVRLPETYWCYQPGGPVPESASLPALSAGFITFACLNIFAKVSPAILEFWVQILRAIPKSRLLIHSNHGTHLNKVRELFGQKGISADRIEFIGRQPWPNYINTYNRIDISLDPLPYNGGITTCDSLFMGVPVVSLSGQTAVGRAGRSILTNIGLPELIAQTPEEYVEIAVKLANDLLRLKKLRSTLRQRMENSPLMDAKRFARNIEAAYREMWRKWCNSSP